MNPPRADADHTGITSPGVAPLRRVVEAGFERGPLRRMPPLRSNPIVHLELHTGDLPRARAIYAELCGWRSDWIETPAGSYLALDVAAGFGGGIVECGARRPLWLPYVEVGDIAEATARAGTLGASVLLEPREGPAGWRSVVATPVGGEIAFWQPKTRRPSVGGMT
jgi:predicted enzyme related to lactoylglutathione lyase